MKAYIVVNILGVFGIDEKGKVIDNVFFKKSPEKIADKLLKKDLLEEEVELIKKLEKKGYKEFVSSKRNSNYTFEENNLGERTLRQEFRQLAKKIGFSDEKLNELLTDVGIQLTKRKIKESVKKDKIVIQAVNAIDEIDKSLNIFVARLREFYGLHFPEMEREVERHEKFVKLVSEYGLRDKMKEFSELAKTSMGIDLSEEDEKVLKEYATKIKELYKLREHMEKYINSVLKEITPNFSALAGPLLAARLIALAGGLEKLAKKPSSTVQLLGSEKALFRYLRGKGRSPKFGILFTHPYIQKAPVSKRGKVARVLASKLSIAIKMDYYGNKDKSKEMKQDLENRIKEMMK